MSFRSRILLALAAVGVLPALLLGRLSYEVNREELLETVGRSQAQTAEELSRSCERFVLDGVESLELALRYIPFDRLSPKELAAVLQIPYRQLPPVNVLVVLDARGRAVAGPVLTRGPELPPGLEGHEPISDADLEVFARRVPLEAALASGAAIGPPYRDPTTGIPRVALALRVDAAVTRVLAAELSLATLERRMRDLALGGRAAFLVDGVGNVLADGAGQGALAPEEEQFLRDGSASRDPLVRTVLRTDGGRWLAAHARVGELGWGVVVAQPTEVAFRAAARVRRYTLFWAGAAVVLVTLLGAFLSRGLSRPVARLSEAARALTEGRYELPGDPAGRDELGRLSVAFRHMAGEVRRRDEEIRGWNAELQRRVEEKTAELRAAEDQIARARRLAAIGSLGAGVSHGLNNPMTSVIGLVSMARGEVGADTPAGEMLTEALQESKRVVRIVQDLGRLAELEREEGAQRFSPARAVRAALDERRARIAARGILLRAEIADDVPKLQGHEPQIHALAGHLLDNAIEATPPGGELRLSVSAVEGDAVKLRVEDTGPGIPAAIRDRIYDPFFTTRPGAGGSGLGLSLSHGIVEAHHGRILVESEEGKGAIFTVLLPAAKEVHLV